MPSKDDHILALEVNAWPWAHVTNGTFADMIKLKKIYEYRDYRGLARKAKVITRILGSERGESDGRSYRGSRDQSDGMLALKKEAGYNLV